MNNSTEEKPRYTPEQLARQDRRKAAKQARNERNKKRRMDAATTHVLIVSHKGLPRAFSRGNPGSFVFPIERKEEVLGKLMNPAFKAYEGWVNWEDDVYLSQRGQHHLWRLPVRVTEAAPCTT